MRFLLASLLLVFASLAAAESPPPLEAYGRLPTLEKVALSPSGNRMAFVASAKGARRLYVQTTAGELLMQAPVDALKVRGVRWAGEDIVLLTTTQHVNLGWYYGFNYEFKNVQALDLKTRKVRSVSGGGRWLDVVFGDYGVSQSNGSWQGVYYLRPMARSIFTGDTYLEGDNSMLVSVDLQSGDFHKLDGGTKESRDWLIGKDGSVLANVQYKDRRGEWRLYAGKDSGRLLDKADDPLGRNMILGQGRKPGTLFYARHDSNGAVHYMEAALSGASRPVEILNNVAADDFEFDHLTGLLAGFYHQGDDQRLEMIDDRQEARLRGTRKAFPGLKVSFGSWSDDFNRITVFTEGAKDSGTWWLVDIPSGKADVIGAAYPGVSDKQVGAVSMVSYRAADGLALQGVLTLPPGAKNEKPPLVVLPHGGPEARDYPEFNWWAQAFASRGYAVWQPNFRGSSGYGIDLLNAGQGQWGRKMLTDISDGMAELARLGIVDPKRACIVGASYGGYAALAGVTLQQGLYRCSVSVAGVADVGTHVRKFKERAREDDLRYLLGLIGADSIGDPVLDTISPAKLAQRADAPVLLIHGKDDTVVRIEQSNIMKRALEKAGKPVEMIVLDGEDHWLSREATRTAMLTAAVAFVERYNPATSLQAAR